MGYGRSAYATFPYAGVGAGAAAIVTDTQTALAVEWSPTTGALEDPVWVDITTDVRSWETSRGRNRELERFQPGRATVVFSNLERQYDSLFPDGPWYGNLKPMRRLRIRETFNGVTYPVFDGFVDRWHLDYPKTGKDATATVTATDAFKIFARTDLGVSVFNNLILDDAPDLYWRLDEKKTSEQDAALVALNHGTLASAADGTYVGPPELGGEALVVRDPGTSMVVTNSVATPGTGFMGVSIANADFDLLGGSEDPFVVEAWVIPAYIDLNNIWVWAEGNGNAQLFLQTANTFRFSVTTSVTTYTVDSAVLETHKRYHLVARFVLGEPLRLWVNGTLTTGGTPAGTISSGTDFLVGHNGSSDASNWVGPVSHVAIWTDAAAAAVDQTWVDAHYTAGTAPWQGDLPAARIDRVLDITEWPSAARELDTGNVAFQSAALNITALEHLQKTAETEFALMFVTRDGNVRFIDQDGVFGRDAIADAVFGDDTEEVGYRQVTFDEGDSTIRNSATISRLNGVAKRSVSPASIDEYGRFEYVLEGLLNGTDSWSQDLADLIVSEYNVAKRRVTSLVLGPASPDEAAVIYPQMLGRELADVVTVRHRPPGGGVLFAQACSIEGIQHAGTPRGMRSATFILSPAPAEIDPVAPTWGSYSDNEWSDLVSTEWGDL